MWLGRDPAIIRDPACIAYLIYTAPASKQDPALDPAYKLNTLLPTLIYILSIRYSIISIKLSSLILVL